MNYIYFFHIAAFNVTGFETHYKMVAMFDENETTYDNIADVLSYRSEMSILNIDNVDKNVMLNVKVSGIQSCTDYYFIHNTLSEMKCRTLKPCAITHDFALSNNTCIVSCPCVNICKITVVLYSNNGHSHGAICEVGLL